MPKAGRQSIQNNLDVDIRRRRYGIRTVVTSPVFTLTVQAVNNNATLHGQDLSDNVRLSFVVDSPDNKVAPQCVFWDTDRLEWSTLGCEMEFHDDDEVACSCSHMTSFAVVMDVTDIKVLIFESFIFLLCFQDDMNFLVISVFRRGEFHAVRHDVCRFDAVAGAASPDALHTVVAARLADQLEHDSQESGDVCLDR